MKPFILLAITLMTAVWSNGAEPVRIADKQGDAKFKKGDPLPAFDLVAVTFEGLAENRLQISFTGDGPMVEKGTVYSWFAVWLDLDVDTTTGDKYSDVGGDLILAAESVRGSEDWTGEVTAKSSIGREFPVKFEKWWVEGNSVHVIYQSDLFEKYPIFRAAAFSHHDGAYSDYLYGGKMNYIQAFDSTEKSVEAPDPFAFKKVLTTSYGKKTGHKFALTPRDRRVALTITPTKLNGGPDFDPKIEFSITSEDKSCAHLRLRQTERGAPMGSYIRTKEGAGSHEEIDLDFQLKTNESAMLEFRWDKGEAIVVIDGKIVKRLGTRISPVSASIFVYSAEILAEELIVE